MWTYSWSVSTPNFKFLAAVAPNFTTASPTATEEIRAAAILLFYISHECFSPHGKTAPSGPGPLHCRGLTITSRHTTLGRTPLDDGLARRRDLYLTTHNTQNRQTSLSTAGFELSIPATERPQTHTSDRADTGMIPHEYNLKKLSLFSEMCKFYRPQLIEISKAQLTSTSLQLHKLARLPFCQRSVEN